MSMTVKLDVCSMVQHVINKIIDDANTKIKRQHILLIKEMAEG